MKTGRTINDLAKEIARQAETKRDFVASTANMLRPTRKRASRNQETSMAEDSATGTFLIELDQLERLRAVARVLGEGDETQRRSSVVIADVIRQIEDQPATPDGGVNGPALADGERAWQVWVDGAQIDNYVADNPVIAASEVVFDTYGSDILEDVQAGNQLVTFVERNDGHKDRFIRRCWLAVF
jgi:hypothetical protein